MSKDLVVIYRDMFPPVFRRALRRHYGQTGMATRDDIRSWIRVLVNSAAEDIVEDYYSREDGEIE